MHLTPELIRICYISRAQLAPGDAAVAQIGAILDRSRAWNEEHGITGALFFNRGMFAQVLEGPMRAVDDIFADICADGRHEGVIRLQWAPIAERRFEGWSMAFVGRAPEDASRFAELCGTEAQEAAVQRDQLLSIMVAALSEHEADAPEPQRPRLKEAAELLR